jgi:hypothetical protein
LEFSAEMLLVHVVTPLAAMHGGVAPTGFHIPAVQEELEGSAKNSFEEIRRETLPAEIQARTFVILFSRGRIAAAQQVFDQF